MNERTIMVYRLKRRLSTSSMMKPAADAQRFEAVRVSEWMFLCLGYLIIAFGIILLTITTTIRCILIAVFELAASMTPLQQQHYQRLRKLLTIGIRTSYRRRRPDSQSALRHYMNENSLLCARHVGGLDHMLWGGELRDHFYKPR